jgi:hypothetical protein
MNQRIIHFTLVAIMFVTLNGCLAANADANGAVFKAILQGLGKTVFKGAAKGVSKGAAKGVSKGVQQADDVASKGPFWKPQAAKQASSVARATAVSTARTGASKTLSMASRSATQCGKKFTSLDVNYALLSPSARVATRIIYLKLTKNTERLNEIEVQLADSEISDRKASQLEAECSDILAENERIDAKIDFLTAELG